MVTYHKAYLKLKGQGKESEFGSENGNKAARERNLVNIFRENKKSFWREMNKERVKIVCQVIKDMNSGMLNNEGVSIG